MSNKVATIILNRNLPDITDTLVEHLNKFDSDYTDIFVIEAGSVILQVASFKTRGKRIFKM